MMMHLVDTFNPNTDHADEIERAIIFRTHFGQKEIVELLRPHHK
jgi:hypothetical protein